MDDDRYTPTTEQVCTVYANAPVDLTGGGPPNPTPEFAAAQFWRWLGRYRPQVTMDAVRAATLAVPDGEWTEDTAVEFLLALGFTVVEHLEGATEPAPALEVEDTDPDALHPGEG